MGLRVGKIGLGVAGLLVGLLLGEGLLGLVAPQVHRRPRVWEFDSELGWRHIPGAAGEMVTPEFELEIAVNIDGLRDREYARDRTPNSWRLLAFGDSFVEGWGVALEHSVSKRLEVDLQEKGGRGKSRLSISGWPAMEPIRNCCFLRSWVGYTARMMC